MTKIPKKSHPNKGDFALLFELDKLPGRDLINTSDALLCLHVPSDAENKLMHSEHIANKLILL